MNDIARMSDKVIVMDHGRKMMDGTPSEVFSHEKELREMGLALPDSMELVSKTQECRYGDTWRVPDDGRCCRRDS